jgi:hypothetical protein
MGSVENIVAYLRKAKTLETENLPLLANGSETTFVSRQRLGKHDPATTGSMKQYRYFWNRCFLLGPCKGVIRKIIGATKVIE